jgi:mono/diheme cytochrome c family protein
VSVCRFSATHADAVTRSVTLGTGTDALDHDPPPVDIRTMRLLLVMRSAGGLAAVALIAAGCGGGVKASANRALLVSGARVLAQSGCEACHRIGDDGNDGPGPSLTAVGAHLSSKAIARALEDPREPMPAYGGRGGLPRNQFTAVVAYLASLRGPGDAIAVPGAPSYVQIPVSPKTLCAPRYFATIVAIAGGAHASKQTKRKLAQTKQRLRGYCRAHGRPSP